LAAGDPTDVVVTIIEYDANGNPSLATITMTVNGGSTMNGGVTPFNGTSFNVNGGVNSSTIMDGLFSILSDCVTGTGGTIDGTILEGLEEQLQLFTVSLPLREVRYVDGDLFGLELSYDQPPSGGTMQKAGNISAAKWQCALEPTQQYTYNYDQFSRLKGAAYTMISDCATANYSMGVNYKDPIGNISTLTRSGFKGYDDNGVAEYDLIDELIYNYTGNILNSVQESAFMEYGFRGIQKNYGHAIMAD